MDNISPLASQIVSGLAKLRKTRGFTQAELAKALNTKQSSISRMEKGAAIPSWVFIDRVLQILNGEAAISFKPLDRPQVTIPNQPIANQEYICVNCLHRWRSRLNLAVIQCPQCHKRQGVLLAEYAETLKAFKEMQFDVSQSPPFRKAPPVQSLKANTPRMMRLVLETAGKTFPSPSLPVSLIFRIVEQSRQAPNGTTVPKEDDIS
jgi:transcriptional regulator with XRE-family HTH domain